MTKLNKPLKLQAGKTYATIQGDIITIKPHEDRDPFYTFEGSNGYFYSNEGTLYEDPLDYEYDENFSDNISHEVQSTDENWHDYPCDDCTEECCECTLFTEDQQQSTLQERHTFKQEVNGVKRKLIFSDFSDGTVVLEFSAKNKNKPKGEQRTTGGIRLSYDALDLLLDALLEIKAAGVQELNERVYH